MKESDQQKPFGLIFVIYGIITLMVLIYIEFFAHDRLGFSTVLFVLGLFALFYLSYGVRLLFIKNSGPAQQQRTDLSGIKKLLSFNLISVLVISAAVIVLAETLWSGDWGPVYALFYGVIAAIVFFLVTFTRFLFSKSRGGLYGRAKITFFVFVLFTIPFHFYAYLDVGGLIGDYNSDRYDDKIYQDLSTKIDAVKIGSEVVELNMIGLQYSEYRRDIKVNPHSFDLYFRFLEFTKEDIERDIFNTRGALTYPSSNKVSLLKQLNYFHSISILMSALEQCSDDISVFEMRYKDTSNLGQYRVYLVIDNKVSVISGYSSDSSGVAEFHESDRTEQYLGIIGGDTLQVCESKIDNEYFSSNYISKEGGIKLLPRASCYGLYKYYPTFGRSNSCWPGLDFQYEGDEDYENKLYRNLIELKKLY